MNTATNLIDDLRILEAPQPWYYWAWWALGIAVLAGIVSWWWKHRQSGADQIAEQVAKHAHEDALTALEKARALIQPGNSKAYAIEVSGIVRRYIENRFGIRAPTRSTEEFMQEAQVSPRLEARHQSSLAEFLGSCDFLKFARGVAEVSELEEMHQGAVRFVTETRMAPSSQPGVAAPEAKEAVQ